MSRSEKVVPCLWFDGAAEAAAALYCAILPDSRIQNVVRHDRQDASGEGEAFVIEFVLGGRTFVAMNGGPGVPFTGAISMVANCETQQELDRVWGALLEGGQAQRCGWLTDRFGVSWQVVPAALPELMRSPDSARRARVRAALMQMVKIDIATLHAA